ncbi:hypothetical protein OIDMADRAFT_62045 [Oidiodendron maius Zn]|uniref:Uncharacterized protein n=1 Tax=Oidiodendron maius (strain Zn) TaxID=913774 RepID=A0A0C3CTA4_OIDMZ|nr:hypothetical protein OIDMADRAFT_62045 [Oidiodendron maius Zn]
MLSNCSRWNPGQQEGSQAASPSRKRPRNIGPDNDLPRVAACEQDRSKPCARDIRAKNKLDIDGSWEVSERATTSLKQVEKHLAILYGAAYLTEQQYESISAILKKDGPSLANNGSPYSLAHSQHAAQAIPGHHDPGPDQYPWLPTAGLASSVHLPLSPAISKRSEDSMGTSSAATVTDGRASSRLESTCEPEGKRQPPTRLEAVKVELKPDISGAIDALLAETSSAADNHGPLLVGMADPVPILVSNNINLVN